MKVLIRDRSEGKRQGILRLRGAIRLANGPASLRMTRAWIITCTFACLLCSARATSYYVSSSGGSDSNAGTSSGAAWQTLAKVNGQTFLPGDSILFRRGDVWNESLVPPSSGTSGSPITFDAYGIGAPPNFTGYYAVPSTAWVLVSGTAWKAAVPSVVSAVNFCLFGSVWGQKVAASTSNLTAQWDFYLASGFIYVYSVGNPGSYYNSPIVPMALSNTPGINVNGKTWLTFQHFLVSWFDQYGVYVQGASDHLVFANMESDSMIPQGTQPLGFYVNESAPGAGDIKIYNSEAHMNYDGFRFDGAATAITLVNDKAYGNRDGALVDNTGAVTYSYCHFYASSLAVAGSTDVEWTSGTGPTAGAGNIAPDTPPAVQAWQRYPAQVTLTVDDAGMTAGADTYYANTVLPIADGLGVPVGAAITVGYPLAQTLVSEFQGWINAGRDVTSHSMSHTYYTNTDALDIQYTGTGTAATMSISGKTLIITVTGAADSVTYNLAQFQAQGTIKALRLALLATGKFTATEITVCQGPYGTGCSYNTESALLAQDLADVSSQDVKSAVYHMQLDVARLTTDEITLSRQWMTTNLTGLPATPVYVYPGGYETPTMQGITAGVPYSGARGALKEDLGVKDTYASGFDVENVTSFGVNPTWMGIAPAALNQKVQALVWKQMLWGVPWGIFWHLNELVNNDPVGGTEITNLMQDLQTSGATVKSNTGLVNWLTSGTLEVGTDGNFYYKSPASSMVVDFRPTAKSPVVDAGQNLGVAYQIDINGMNQNSYGGGWEIGAHAFAGYAIYGVTPPGSSHFTIGEGTSPCEPPNYCAYTGAAIVNWPSVPNMGGLTKNGTVFYDTSFPSGTPSPVVRCTDTATAPTNPYYSKSAGLGGSGAAAPLMNVNDTLLHVNDSGGDNWLIPFNPSSLVCGAAITANLNQSNPGLSGTAFDFGSGYFDWTNPSLYYGVSGTQIVPYTINPSTGQFAVGGIDVAPSLASNSSACAANGAPTAGCNGIGSMPFAGNAGDTGAQTTTLNPLPAAVSTQSVKSYLYSGAATRVMAEYQPWFCNTSTPCNTHKNIGMEQSTAAQALVQAQWMKSVGADVTDVDYYGCSTSCSTPQSSTMAYNLTVTTALANAIAANPSTTPKFLILLDEGAIDGSGTGQCPPASGDQSACLIAAIDTQVDYLAATWLYQSYYETNATNGHPIVMYFINPGMWPDTNFNTVYGAVSSHATASNSCGGGCTYTTTVDFVDQDAGAFTESGIAGGFAWPQPDAWSSTNQFCWEGNPCSFNYLADFYSTARAHSSKIAVGVLYKGFDDNNANWGSNRVIAQQCGQVFGFTAAAISTAGYSSLSQLQYVQLATWNDYEEGTEVETGIDNCITVGRPAISSGTLSWSLVKSDATYANTSTIGSFSIYTGTSSPTTLYASGIAASATSYSPAPTLAAGQNAWVEMIGRPLIQNRLSPGVFGPPAADFQYGLPMGSLVAAWQPSHAYTQGQFVTYTLTGAQAPDWTASKSTYALGDLIQPALNNPDGCAFKLVNTGTTGSSPPTWSTTGNPCHTTEWGTYSDGTAAWRNLGGPAVFTYQLTSASGTTGASTPAFVPVASGHPDLMTTVTDGSLTWTNTGVEITPAYRDFAGISFDGTRFCQATSTNVYGYNGSYANYNGGQGSSIWAVCYNSTLNEYVTLNTATGWQSLTTCTGGTGYNCSGGTFAMSPMGSYTAITSGGCGYFIHNMKGSLTMDYPTISQQANLAGALGCEVGNSSSWSPFFTFNASGGENVYLGALNHWAILNTHLLEVGQSSNTFGYTSGAYTNIYQSTNANVLSDVRISWQPPCMTAWVPNASLPPCEFGSAYDSHMSGANNPGGTDTYPVCGSMYNYATLAPPPVAPWQGEAICIPLSPTWASGASPIGQNAPWRFTHEFNSGGNSFFDVQFAISQESTDGKFLAFTSDWNCTLGNTAGGSTSLCGAPWVGGAVYSTGQYVNPFSATGGAGTNYGVYEVTTGGTSSATQPSWLVCNSGTSGNSVTDSNGVVYTCQGSGNGRGDVFIVRLAP